MYRSLETIQKEGQAGKTTSSSQSAIYSIKKICSANKAIQLFQEAITNVQAREVNLVFAWVPSHIGIGGNEKTDIAARNESLIAPVS